MARYIRSPVAWRRLLRQPFGAFLAGLGAHARRIAASQPRGSKPTQREARAWAKAGPEIEDSLVRLAGVLRRGVGYAALPTAKARQLRETAREAVRELRALPASQRREVRLAVGRLGRGARALQVRTLGALFDASGKAAWGGSGLVRQLWIRRWGLDPRRPLARPLRGAALQAALHWLAEDFDEPLAPAALSWWERAARAGDADAAGMLAYEYAERARRGHARRGDRSAARRWEAAGAQLGDPGCCVSLGRRLFYSRGHRSARAQAAHWYLRAARSPLARSHDRIERLDPTGAMANLGRMYRKGKGVRQSWPRAIGWFTRAARLGSADALHFLVRIYDGDEGLPARPAKALRWLRRGASRGHVESMVGLGVHLWNGKHVRRNRPRAVQLYTQAAQAGDRWAMYLLGLAYREIEAPHRDLTRSRLWLRRAAARGLKEARRALRAHPTRRARGAVAPPA
jgi:TPR repeat protein